MKIPRINSRAWQILKAFADAGRPMTFDEACAIHGHMGEFPTHTRSQYKNHVLIGNLIQDDVVYRLNASVKNYFDGLHKQVVPEVTSTIALPRTPNMWKGAGKHVLKIPGGRPGATDYQNIPSLMGGERVAYHSACRSSDEGDVK